MIESINSYLILITLLWLLLLAMVGLAVKYREHLLIYFPFLMKLPLDTVIKGFAAGAFILFLRKVLYYVPLVGIIQTKSSIWQMHEKVMVGLIGFFFMMALITLNARENKVLKKLINTLAFWVTSYILSTFILTALLAEKLHATLPQVIVAIALIPLLFLKLLVSGKYLGIFTSFVVGYFIIDRYKKRKSWITSNISGWLFTACGLLMVLLFFNFPRIQDQGVWQIQNNRVMSVTSECDMIDLLDAVNSIDQGETRYVSFEQMISLMIKEEDPPWKKEIYQVVIDEVNDLPAFWSTKLLRKTSLWIAGTGDIPWASSVAKSIPNEDIKNSTLKQIREKVEKK
jgi:hypothetical protein